MNIKEAIEKVKNLTTVWINYQDLNDDDIVKAEEEEKEIIGLLNRNEVIE